MSLGNDCCHIFPNHNPNTKENPPRAPKNAPTPRLTLRNQGKKKKKAQITGQFMTTSLPNFPLNYLAAPPQQHYLHAGKKQNQTNPKTANIHLTKPS